MNKKLSTTLLSMIISTCLAFGQHQADVDAAFREAQRIHSLALSAYQTGDLLNSERLCLEAIAKCLAVKRSFPPSHILLGRIYLMTGRDEKAGYEVSEGWRPGRDGIQDLLVAVAGSRSKKENFKVGADTGLFAFLRNSEPVNRLIGSADLLPYSFTHSPSSIDASSSILLAASPDIPAWEALKYATAAESKAHGFPITTYVLGKAYTRLGEYAKAKECFDRIGDKAPQKLRNLIQAARTANDALMDSSGS